MFYNYLPKLSLDTNYKLTIYFYFNKSVYYYNTPSNREVSAAGRVDCFGGSSQYMLMKDGRMSTGDAIGSVLYKSKEEYAFNIATYGTNDKCGFYEKPSSSSGYSGMRDRDKYLKKEMKRSGCDYYSAAEKLDKKWDSYGK